MSQSSDSVTGEPVTSQELAKRFNNSFGKKSDDLRTRLSLVTPESSAASQAFNTISNDLVSLRKEVNDAISFLPAYDQGLYDRQLKEFEDLLLTIRRRQMPKAKFGFKRKIPSEIPSLEVAPKALVSNEDSKEVLPLPDNARADSSFNGLSYAFISPSLISKASSDAHIFDLDHCIVNLMPPIASHWNTSRSMSVHARKVKDSVLILGNVQGSILLDDLERCTVVVSCHQFRMLSSHNVEVYLYTESSPVIERSSGISFSCYPFDGHLESKPNILDFSHVGITPSPNWTTLPDTKVIPTDRWINIRNIDNKDLSRGDIENFLSLCGH